MRCFAKAIEHFIVYCTQSRIFPVPNVYLRRKIKLNNLILSYPLGKSDLLSVQEMESYLKKKSAANHFNEKSVNEVELNMNSNTI